MNAQATWQTQFSVETSATVEMIWRIFRDVGTIADSRWQTPLVPTSQCAILATGAIREAPVVRNGAIVVGRVMSASLTFDHRIVNGVPAALFLKTLGAILEGGVRIRRQP